MPKISEVKSELLELDLVLMDLVSIKLSGLNREMQIYVDPELRVALYNAARRHFSNAIKRFHVKPGNDLKNDQIDFDLENQRDDYSVIEGDSEGNVPASSVSPDTGQQSVDVLTGQLIGSNVVKKRKA